MPRHSGFFGAGDGNRTRVVCLGSRSVAIAPHLQIYLLLYRIMGGKSSPSWDMPQVRAFFKKEYKMQIF